MHARVWGCSVQIRLFIPPLHLGHRQRIYQNMFTAVLNITTFPFFPEKLLTLQKCPHKIITDPSKHFSLQATFTHAASVMLASDTPRLPAVLTKAPPFLGNLCSFDFSAVFTAVCCWAAFSPLLYELRQHRRGDCVDDNSLATCNQGKTEDTQQVFIHRKPQMLQLNTCKSDSCETSAHKAISSSPGDLQQQQVHFKEAAGVTTIKELSDFNK